MDAAIDTGIPKPITNPKLIAKDVAAKAFLSILPSKYSGTMALNPSLKTAIPAFDNIAANAPKSATTKYCINNTS